MKKIAIGCLCLSLLGCEPKQLPPEPTGGSCEIRSQRIFGQDGVSVMAPGWEPWAQFNGEPSSLAIFNYAKKTGIIARKLRGTNCPSPADISANLGTDGVVTSSIRAVKLESGQDATEIVSNDSDFQSRLWVVCGPGNVFAVICVSSPGDTQADLECQTVLKTLRID